MTKRAKLWTAGAVLVVASYAVTRSSPPVTESQGSPEPSRLVSYVVAESWEIPNGGFGKVIIVAPANRNDADLRLLGDQLRRETSRDRNAVVEIYDASRAVSLRRDAFAERLSKADQAFYDQHKIGIYTRNANTGHHSLVLMLDGLNGEFTTIEYR